MSKLVDSIPGLRTEEQLGGPPLSCAACKGCIFDAAGTFTDENGVTWTCASAPCAPYCRKDGKYVKFIPEKKEEVRYFKSFPGLEVVDRTVGDEKIVCEGCVFANHGTFTVHGRKMTCINAICTPYTRDDGRTVKFVPERRATEKLVYLRKEDGSVPLADDALLRVDEFCRYERAAEAVWAELEFLATHFRAEYPAPDSAHVTIRDLLEVETMLPVLSALRNMVERRMPPDTPTA